ncbi:hypothetical protein LTR37_001052 [Vermiconidia calcicola]|uniref:Uncharacterized protein n=1 Tax=Vermiconidia calcicola TaxID=1690605 RepID=A0ACC3NWN7_9PEZI|nr:hypothetical protein LTR37_001052 [Vermiconidia calcicola]
MDRALRELESLESRVGRLETGQLVFMALPAIKICQGQMRYDLIKKLRESPTVRSDKPTEFSSKPQVATFDEATRLDHWADHISNKGFRKFLADRALLVRLDKYWLFIHDSSLQGVRNNETHEEQWKQYAFFIESGAKSGSPHCEEHRDYYYEAFRFTYGMTWAEAAEQAKKRPL